MKFISHVFSVGFFLSSPPYFGLALHFVKRFLTKVYKSGILMKMNYFFFLLKHLFSNFLCLRYVSAPTLQSCCVGRLNTHLYAFLSGSYHKDNSRFLNKVVTGLTSLIALNEVSSFAKPSLYCSSIFVFCLSSLLLISALPFSLSLQSYLHSMSIIHRDLNSHNCLVKLVCDLLYSVH